jgi:hypothetical protein
MQTQARTPDLGPDTAPQVPNIDRCPGNDLFLDHVQADAHYTANLGSHYPLDVFQIAQESLNLTQISPNLGQRTPGP